MNYDVINTFLISATIVSAIFFSIILFSSKLNKRTNKWLGWFMIATASYNCLLITLYQTNVLLAAIIFIISNSSSLLLIPFLYFYFKKLTSTDLDENKIKVIHFIPAIISLISLLILCLLYPIKDLDWYYHLPASYYDFTIEINYLNIAIILIEDIPFVFQLLVYGFLFVGLLKKHKRNILDRFTNIEKINLNWFKAFLISYSIFIVLYLFLLYVLKIDYLLAEVFFSLLNLSYVIFFGYFGIKQFEIYVEKVNLKLTKQGEIQEINKLNLNSKSKPTAFLVNKVKQTDLGEKIENLFYDQKPYLDEKLTLSGLAEMLNTNKSYLSAFFNQVLKTSFYSYINKKRIAASIEMFENPEFDKYTIEGIAKLSGFTSKSTFNNNFKIETGLIPSVYRKRIYEK